MGSAQSTRSQHGGGGGGRNAHQPPRRQQERNNGNYDEDEDGRTTSVSSQKGATAGGGGGGSSAAEPPPTPTVVDKSPYRPAAILTAVVSASPKLIGWDDARMQQIAREAAEEGRRERRERQTRQRQRQQQQQQLEGSGVVGGGATAAAAASAPSAASSTEENLLDDELLATRVVKELGPDETERDVLQEIGFGLLGIAAETVTDYLLKSDETKDDGKDGAPYNKSIRDKKSPPGDGRQAANVALGESRSNDGSAAAAAAEDAIESPSSSSSTPSPGAADGGNKTTMRDMELYQFALNSVRWQRDAYLVGTPYAEARRRQRRMEDRVRRDDVGVDVDDVDGGGVGGEASSSSSPSPQSGRMPEVAAAMLRRQMSVGEPSPGRAQLTQLGVHYLPSETTRSALLPTVLWLPGPGGPLDHPCSRAVTNIIPMSQSNLDWVLKDTVLWVLKDDSWRDHVKYGAGSYVTNMRRDGGSV